MTDLALVGGTVADVYTGTWIRANVEVANGVITYVGPRKPNAARTHDVTGKVLVPGYIEPHAHPWCLYSPTSLLEAAIPDGTTTLVYDNLFFFLAHGVEGLRAIVEQMRAAPAHVYWNARIAPQSAYPDEATRFAHEVIQPLFSWPEVLVSGHHARIAASQPRTWPVRTGRCHPLAAAARCRDRRRRTHPSPTVPCGQS